jgi:hypothetical protein
MFMHVSPEANMFGETVSTLKFATRVAQITLGQVRARGCGLVCARQCCAFGARSKRRIRAWRRRLGGLRAPASAWWRRRC